MKIAGIDFPEPLLKALRDGKLVIFAGAGVSMGPPACLPNFKSLANKIAEGTGKTLQCKEPIDRFLGGLQDDKEVPVHDLAAKLLSPEGLKATELHHNLLRLYSGAEQIRVVTTNFDRLFEQAAEKIFDNPPDVFGAPALPLGHQFNGIVHVHGETNRSYDMVLTDKDFGRAYLTEGWARRFLVQLFTNFTTLFVGYSHEDTIMKYLSRALPNDTKVQRFALSGEQGNDIDWKALGIEPIIYPQSDSNDYSVLYEDLRKLAKFFQQGVLDWHREITEISGKPPPLDTDEETADLIKYALEDETKTRFFTQTASDPEWIDWLDKHGHLNPLFGNSKLDDRYKVLSRWLVEQFARNHADKLFVLINKHNMRLHRDFWDELGWQIGVDKETWDKDVLSRWISLLLDTVQVYVGTDNRMYIGPGDTLYRIAEHCIEHEMLDNLLQIFDVMSGYRFQLQDFSWSLDGENTVNLPFVQLPLIGVHGPLNELWDKGLKPKLPQVAERLLNCVIKRLEEQYRTLCAWGNAHRKWEPANDGRSAIEPHVQDKYPQAIDVLIDGARDCLKWLASKQVETAARWCDRHVCSDAPLLRRLAVYGLSKRGDLTADEKIDWLLTHTELHESALHHEVFQAVRQAYPEASPERRETIIEAVCTYHPLNEEDPDSERLTARRHFDWFDWLHKSDSNCTLARQALDEVLARYPHLEPRPYPDLTHWIGLDSVIPHPLSSEELLERPIEDWLDNLLSSQETELDHPNYRILMRNFAESTKQDFDWSLNLAEALNQAEQWDTDLWSTLIYAWSTMELGEARHRKVLSWLGKTELYPKHNRAIVDALYVLVKDGGFAYTLDLLPQANEIAATLWLNLDRSEPIEEKNNWLSSSLHHSAGDLAKFWLSGFLLWRKQQDPESTTLSDEYSMTLSEIVRDQSLPGKFGRTILASQFANLLAVDEVWTQENLLPLFEPDSDDFQVAWDGFLTWGRLNPAVAEAMANLFLKAVERINSDLSNQRNRFIEYYIYMLTDFATASLDEWILKLFQNGSQETKDCFASEVARRLLHMDEAKQQEWWERWLKRHWENRLQNKPDRLEPGEVARMLGWLPHLTSVFPDAVKLAIQMPPAPLEPSLLVPHLAKSDLLQNHPEAVAKLLIYLWKCDRRYARYPGQKIINELLPLNISSELKRELEEIKVQL